MSNGQNGPPKQGLALGNDTQSVPSGIIPTPKAAPKDLFGPVDLRQQVNGLLTIDLAAISELPESHTEIAALRWTIDANLYLDFRKTRLSHDELRLFKNHTPDFIPAPLRRKWDCYILDAAQQYGGRLLLATLVMSRVWAFASGEKDGDRKLRNLFNAIYSSARIGLRRAKGSTSKRHKDAKPILVPQLEELQIRLRLEWPETADAIRLFVATEIETSPEVFPNLKRNLVALSQFLGDDMTEIAFRGSRDFKRVKGDLTPVRFYEKWIAFADNCSAKSVRRALTTL